MNIPSVIVLFILISITTLIVTFLISSAKKGKSLTGCNCSGCTNCSNCNFCNGCKK